MCEGKRKPRYRGTVAGLSNRQVLLRRGRGRRRLAGFGGGEDHLEDDNGLFGLLPHLNVQLDTGLVGGLVEVVDDGAGGTVFVGDEQSEDTRLTLLVGRVFLESVHVRLVGGFGGGAGGAVLCDIFRSHFESHDVVSFSLVSVTGPGCCRGMTTRYTRFTSYASSNLVWYTVPMDEQETSHDSTPPTEEAFEYAGTCTFSLYSLQRQPGGSRTRTLLVNCDDLATVMDIYNTIRQPLSRTIYFVIDNETGKVL